MKLLSWNIRQGGGARIPAQIAAIMGRGADLVALQEVTARSAPLYRAQFRGAGLAHVVDSFELSDQLASLTGPRRYGELVASRWPLRPLSPARFSIPWTERILSVLVHAPTDVIALHTTHVPPGSSNGWVKIETLEGLFERLSRPSEYPTILCGDFNTPQVETVDGRVVTWAQTVHPDGRIATRRSMRGGPGERWDRAERAVVEGLAAHGLIDVYRALNGYEVRDCSWYWTGNGRRLGWRFDLVFASPSLNARECGYLQALCENGLSDHVPIEVSFA